MSKPIIGITMGDAAGIGPEITAKAYKNANIESYCRPFVLGDAKIMRKACELAASGFGVRSIGSVEDIELDGRTINVLDYDDIDADSMKPGVVDPMCGRAAVKYTIEAGNLAVARKIDAMVSAPRNKEAMRMAGYDYEGQTEILGRLTGSKNYGMVLVLGNLRIMMYTTHMSLRDACDAVKRDKIIRKVELADSSLKFCGIESPRIAVSALNPHAGEGGLFGREEIDEIIPAVEDLASRGINVTGPIPADTVFVKANEGEYDLVLAMFHDQANIVMKILKFGDVVTLLAGLPIIRTSVGHGTAFDIAWKGVANERNLAEAIRVASEMALLSSSASK